MKSKYFFIPCLLVVSGCEEALERPLTGQRVTLLSPVNNLATTDTTQTFYWEKLNDALQYQLQIVSPRFDSIVRLINDTIISTNRFVLDMDTGRFQWRVKALNNSSESDNSDIWNLKIQ
jgi:outer membrane protein assembly factor BamB